MTEFKHYPLQTLEGTDEFITIASGPVIIQDNKVLLSLEKGETMWKFPGGTLHDDYSIRDNAVREAKEEACIDVRLIDEPLILTVNLTRENKKETIILFHYLAEITSGEVKAGEDIEEVKWFDINDLPNNCAPNIHTAIEKIKQKSSSF